jgi:hypothetical protein
MKPFVQNRSRVLLSLVVIFWHVASSAQNNLRIESSGQTGTSGTNWSISGNILTVIGGDASIQASVINNHLQSAGNLTVVASGNIVIEQSILPVISTPRALTLKSDADIILAGATSIAANGNVLQVICWADTDGSNGGMIYCKTGSSINSNGGHIWMAGGSGASTWNGLAVGNGYARAKTILDISAIQQLNNQSQDYQNAITLDNASITSGGGDIYLAGQSSGETAAYGHIGLLIQRGSTISSAAGKISLTGLSSSIRNASGWFWGVLLASDRGAEPNTIHSTSGDITILGEASTAYNFNHSGGIGVFEWQVGTMGVNEISSASGNILLDGNNKNTSNASYGGLVFSGGSSASRRVYNQTGDITLTGKSSNTTTNGISVSSGLNLGYDGENPCSSNIYIKTNRLAALPASARVKSSGELAIETLTASTTIGIAGGTGTLSLPASYFSTNFVDGFSRIVIGSNSQTGNIASGAVVFNDKITLNTSGTVSQTGAITSSGQELDLQRGSFNLSGSTNAISTVSGNAASIRVTNSTPLEVKNIATSGLINIRALNSDITLNGNISSQSTSGSAVIIAAGANSAAGVASGGNIIVNGTPAITAGTGGTVRLYAGTLSGSSGLYQLVNADPSRLRFNVDVAVPSFNPALSAGINLLLRETGAIWNGSTTDYNTGTNWRSTTVPTAGSTIVIDPSATADLVLDAARTIGDLHFNGSNRKLILGSFNLTMGGTVYGTNASNYIRTNGTGQLIKTIPHGASFDFPVGNSSFNRVTITNHTGSPDEMRVRVIDAVYENGYSGAALSSGYVNRTWDISKANTNAGAGIDLSLHWNNDEVNSALATPALFHYGTGWERKTGTTNFTSGNLTYQGYTGSFSPFAVGDAAVTLPVTWIGFTAIEMAGNIRLQWKTTMEENAKLYIIQHSPDGRNWTELGKVTAYGNTQAESSYTYIHKQPAGGNHYYRLLQQDNNGSFSFSKTITFSRTPVSAMLTVYPNPVSNGIVHVQIAEAGTLQLFNAGGKMIWQRPLGKGLHSVALDNLPAGLYFMKAGTGMTTLIIR